MNILRKVFTPSDTHAYYWTQDFLAIITIVSIIAVVLETVPAFATYEQSFLIIEWVAVVIFSIEYFGRLSVSKPRWRYPLSFFGVVDLVSIAPTLLGLGNFTWLKSARALRIIRLLRMVRLIKVSRRDVGTEDMSVLSLGILIYFVTLLTSLLFIGTALYIAEPQTESFASIPAAMWWSLQVFLTNIPVEQPITAWGMGLRALAQFVGLLLVGLLIGVIGAIFKTYVIGQKR